MTEKPASEEQVCEAVRDRIRQAGLWSIPGVDTSGARTHMVSPEPFALTTQQVSILGALGDALLAFYGAVNDLYLRAGHDWVKHYLDTGKPPDLLRYSRMNFQKRALPGIIRPDILIAEDGSFVITELDSVPGGFGHLDCLSAAYADAGFELVGSNRGVRDGFASILRSAAGSEDPACAIVVSEESVDYLPEMQYLAGEVRRTGLRAYTVRPNEVAFSEDGLWIEADGERLRADVVYRFFELFDLLNIPKSELMMYAAKKKLAVVTPPYKPFLEEKMLLALVHDETLAPLWSGAMGDERYELLRSVVSPTWILDSRPVPPHAEIARFKWKGLPIRDWREIGEGTQKERQLVLKPSGFSPLAWGSRGVRVGHDMPQQEWAAAVDEALASFETSPFVLQPFRDTALVGVKYYDESAGEVRERPGRVRLCPYYFVSGGRPELGGVLATICPRDKKLIHGMVDAVLAPCRVAVGS